VRHSATAKSAQAGGASSVKLASANLLDGELINTLPASASAATLCLSSRVDIAISIAFRVGILWNIDMLLRVQPLLSLQSAA